MSLLYNQFKTCTTCPICRERHTELKNHISLDLRGSQWISVLLSFFYCSSRILKTDARFCD
jgi:hypothetical protein